jgi:AcrR family transcriptional regulator
MYHEGMPLPRDKPYEATGRTHQKHRTRDALIAAARELVAKGFTPTIEEAAAATAISRTTAYRYFPTRAALLEAAHPEIAFRSLLPRQPPDDVRERLRIVVRRYLRMMIENEVQMRTMLRLSLEAEHRELPLRQGRVIGWLEDALAPLRERMGAAAVRRLAITIRSATGIESFVWLVDVAGQSRDEALKIMRWSASSLLDAALAEDGLDG